MFETVLAAVDGSPHGDLVAQKAGELAGLCDARLVLAYIADPGTANDDLERLATVEHLKPQASGAEHPNIARVPSWFDEALTKAESEVSVFQVLETLGAQVLEGAAYQAKQRGAQTIERILEGGDPASCLLQIADREGADLIVIGSRGLGRIKEILLGSVSHKVTMMAHCPCLVVK